MQALNRNAIVVRAKQPMLTWLHRIDPTSATLGLDDLNDEPSVYLLPECGNEADASQRLRRLYAKIFEEELAGWWLDVDVWPKRRTFPLFEQWFEWSYHPMVLDLDAKELERETL